MRLWQEESRIMSITVLLKPERKDDDGDIRCECGEKTVLLTPRHWEAAEEPGDYGFGCDDIEFDISGHYCPKCLILVALTYNF